MNATTVRKVADALLYEGYILYPYRPSSVKNQQRFNFGVLYPRAYSEQQEGSDPWFSQTECLINGSPSTTLSVSVRFLHLAAPSGATSAPEAIEREVNLPSTSLKILTEQPLEWNAIFPEWHSDTSAPQPTLRPVRVSISVSAHSLTSTLFKATIQSRNAAPQTTVSPTRDEALLYSLISAHTILETEEGEFVSLLDPPEEFQPYIDQCINTQTFPVLIGNRTERRMMLSSPIILYDYPEVAPESAGDLFDATEIDEILSLRILTLTDAEKEEVRNSGERARSLLENVESLPEEHLLKLHGALRGLRPVEKETHNE